MTTVDTTTAWAPQRRQVRQALQRQGLSQARLAHKIGVTEKHISQMLTGKADGKTEMWVAMAKVLGLEWQLRPPDPNAELMTWAREQLDLELAPWQAARLRMHVAESL